MKIHANTDFMHGRQKFESGKNYQLPGRTGGYFVHNGWATEVPDDTPDAEYIEIAELEAAAPTTAPVVTLDIHSPGQPQSTTDIGV